MSFPQAVPADRQIVGAFFGVLLMAILMWAFFTYLERYAERKERELEKELEELEQGGDVY